MNGPTGFGGRLRVPHRRLLGGFLCLLALFLGASLWAQAGWEGWTPDGGLVAAADGLVAKGTDGGTATAVLDRAAGVYRVAATVRPVGSSCVSIGLGGEGMKEGSFFQAAEMALTLASNGSFEVTAKGQGKIVSGNRLAFPDFDAAGANRLELSYDATSGSIGASINGSPVLRSAAIPGFAPDITVAGVRLNGPVTDPRACLITAEAAVLPVVTSGFTPVDYQQFYVTPGEAAVLRWTAASMVPDAPLAYGVEDFAGLEIATGQATVTEAGVVELPVTLARGYYTVRFPASREAFGVVVSPVVALADPFFGMDSALSWLELRPAVRADLVQVLRRSGIAVARERMNTASLQRGQATWDWAGGARDYDRMRSVFAEAQVPLLELLWGSSGPMAPKAGYPFPTNLVGTAAAWTPVTRRWQSNWAGAEVWNEPNLVPWPADQYVGVVHAARVALGRAASPASLVVGAFGGIPNASYLETCAANGMLDGADAVSFHTYDRAPDLQGAVSTLRDWLAASGAPNLPLWHSECGWPWTNGPSRPPQDEDTMSALQIAAKAVESRACGVERYFPFVYVYYEEGARNFGMLGREVTPLRSMGAYVACASLLAGSSYLGDLADAPTGVTLARVFGWPDGRRLATLYTGQPTAADSAATISAPAGARRALGLDGRELPLVDGHLAIPDGFAYVWLDPAAATPLRVDTPAARLLGIAAQPRPAPAPPSPVVVQFLPEHTPSRVSSRCYLLSQATAAALPVHARFNNLGDTPLPITPVLTLPDGTRYPLPPVTLAPAASQDIAWTVSAAAALDIVDTRFITVTAEVGEGLPTPPPLAIPCVLEGELAEFLRRHPTQRALPIRELDRWTSNIVGHGTLTFSADGEGWHAGLRFTERAACWAYPKFRLPQPPDPTLDVGFILRARVHASARNVGIMAHGIGAENWRALDLFPADGQWHTVFVPFADFVPGPGHPDMQNARLDVDHWQTLAVGLGSDTQENAMDISDFLIVGR